MQVEISLIQIDRDSRQRSKLPKIEELADSLRRLGQIQPIVLAHDLTLIAGERRLAAAQHLGWTHIDAISQAELPAIQLQLIELEENIKREDLPWQDQVRAIETVVQLRRTQDPDCTMESIASSMGLSRPQVSKCYALAKAMHKEAHADLASFASMRTAYNTLERRQQRVKDSAVSELEDTLQNYDPYESVESATRAASDDAGTDAPVADGSPATRAHNAPSGADSDPVPAPAPAVFQYPAIQQADFLKWAPQYDGGRFNFIHCDFPYGINHDQSEQGGADRWGSYADSEEVFFSLLDCLLENTNNLAASSAHLMFWFSMKHYVKIMRHFESSALLLKNPWRVFPMPLIWVKSDGGMMPDARRRPLQIYETALLAVRGDRKVVQAVPNAVTSWSKSKSLRHQSHKPEPMLDHFFRMLVDSSSRVLDPTAGSGSAILTAHRRGAESVVGLELDPETVKDSNIYLKREVNRDES